MTLWPKYPIIFEINTWVWLDELSKKYGRDITLSSIPQEEWDYLTDLGFNTIWLMGIWKRSPAAIEKLNMNKNFYDNLKQTLSDFKQEDNVGSPYCVQEYVVEKRLGGAEGLEIARDELAKRNLNLILDFIPNHLAPDHSWVIAHPEYFIQGNPNDEKKIPEAFVQLHGKVFAYGKDPNFPPWPDVLQLNSFNLQLREEMINTLSYISTLCDGVRCDMAMLMLNKVFENTWKDLAGEKPKNDYWTSIIPAIKEKNKNFKFIAEVYWDLEWELQQQGFDYCYDKKLYDLLNRSSAENIRLHLSSNINYQEKMVRFIENHDEKRAAAILSSPKEHAALVIISTIPGAKLFHEGQLEGKKIHLPLFLGRRPPEKVDSELLSFYKILLKEIQKDIFQSGQWILCQRSGWSDNLSFINILSWYWFNEKERYLIIINYSNDQTQAQIQVPEESLIGKRWRLRDLMTNKTYEMKDSGLYVDLSPWNFHFFCLSSLQ